MRNQSGFTLIELVVVIVVLGILAAVAVPKYVDLKSDAADAAVEGVAGGLASASAMNYAKELVSSDGVNTSAGCKSSVATSLLDGVTISDDATGDYKIEDQTAFDDDASTGDKAICKLTDNKNVGSTATFMLIYVD